MIIDSSAIVAILLEEPGSLAFAEAVERAEYRAISAATLVETSIVLEARRGLEGARDLDQFIYRAAIEVVAVDAGQAHAARTAWRRFGKGNHPALLNYGDLFAYALAKVTGEPLLYTGADFARTDVVSAMPGPLTTPA